MAHHNSHGGYARQAQRRGEQYCQCNTCGQINRDFQAEQHETFGDFAKALVVAVMLVAAGYAAVLVVAAYEMGR